MVNIFNRKVLVTDVSSEEITRVTNILKENSIEYFLRTIRNTNTFMQTRYVRSQMKFNQIYHKEEGPHLKFVYRIYVNKKDFSKAKSIT